LLEAQLATQRIEELREQELQHRGIQLMERHKVEVSRVTSVCCDRLRDNLLRQQKLEELEKTNLHQFNEFNKEWDRAIAELNDNLKSVEEELMETHRKEQIIFDEEVAKIELPKVKYSREVLNLRVIFDRMVKAKQ
jgi:hypothetical protein